MVDIGDWDYDSETSEGRPFTYNKVHVAAKGQLLEADDHADLDRAREKGLPIKSRTIEIGSVDELKAAFQTLIRDNFKIDYLDFHAHGHAGAFYVNDSLDTFTINSLAQFQNGFENLFRPDAIISFMACDVASVDRGDGEDGELFMAEMARTFLHLRGGSVIGRNKDWQYKHALGLGLLPPGGPLAAKFKNDGAEIVAEIAPRAVEPFLRGHFRLDQNRLGQEIAALTSITNAAIGAIRADDPLPKKSYAPGARSKSPIDDLVASYVANRQNQEVLNSVTAAAKNLTTLTRALALLDGASKLLRGYGRFYQRLHSVSVTIDDAVDAIISTGVPLAQILPAVLTAIRALPINP